mgnify:CR=1 FL=1
MRRKLLISLLSMVIIIFWTIQSFVFAQLINKSISLGPYPVGDRYYVRVFNVDDVSRVKVNGREVLSVGYYQERDIDITPYLREGQNTIELILENTGGGWTYGYELKKGGVVIWSDSCGSVGREGCNRNDQTKGIVARHVINMINLTILSPQQQVKSLNVIAEDWSFAIITDLHIGRGLPKPLKVILDENYYLTKRLEKVVEWINKNKDNENIKFLVVLGDVADKVESDNDPAHGKAKEILDKLNIPYFVVIGNHDIKQGKVFGEPYSFLNTFGISFVTSQYKKLSGKTDIKYPDLDYHNYAFSYNGIRFIFLDTISRTRAEDLAFGSGDLSNFKTFLEDEISNSTEPIIIFSHIPLIKSKFSGFSENEFKVLTGLLSGKKILANFAGHIHGYHDPDKKFKSFDLPCGAVYYMSYEEFKSTLESTPMFMNMDYCIFQGPAGIPGYPTEALMVGVNEENKKGFLRIVKIKNGEIVSNSIVNPDLPKSLNPYFNNIVKPLELTTNPILFSDKFSIYTFNKLSGNFEYELEIINKETNKLLKLAKVSQQRADFTVIAKRTLKLYSYKVKLTIKDKDKIFSEEISFDYSVPIEILDFVTNSPDNWRFITSFENGGAIFAGGRPFHYPFDDGTMMNFLQENSIQVIISLEDSEKITKKEKELAEKRGMEFYSPWVNKVKSPQLWECVIPDSQFSCPSKEQLEDVVNLLYTKAKEEGKKVYVHCYQGVDRTGMVIATFRHLKEGQQLNKVIDEWGKLESKCPPYRSALIKCFQSYFGSSIERLQIFEILPPVIETSNSTHKVTLTLKGKGFSQVNEISFCWAGPDTCYDSGGPKIWRKGDKNWTNSLTIESDEKMSLKIYVLWNEPPTKEVKEWTWTITLKNSQGETASKEFKVRYLPSLCPGGIEYTHPPHPDNVFDHAGLRGYCTWYAAERWLWDGNSGLPSTRHAYLWREDAERKGFYVDTKKPVRGSIVVFNSTNENRGGHVAYVESVDEENGSFIISQMNAGTKLDQNLRTECFNKVTYDTLKIGQTKYKGMELIGFIYPKTFSPLATGRAVALVIDHSGSMGYERKLELAQEAARSYIDSVPEEDYVSVAGFSTDANSIVELSPIKTSKEKLKQGIFSLHSTFSTNIGAGLRVGLEQLFAKNKDFSERFIILLSDGMHNTGELWPWVENCKRKQVKVYTVAFGSDADQATLCKIAHQTGGRCFPAGLKNLSHVYHKINTFVHNYSTLFASNDWLRPGQELIYRVYVPPDFKELTFFTNWQGSSIQTAIVKPDGSFIYPSSQIGDYQKGKTYSIFRVPAEPGPWEMRLKGQGLPEEGEQINVSISGRSEIYSNFFTFQPEYKKGQSVLIRIEVGYVSGYQKIPLENIKVKAEIVGPTPQILKKTAEGKIEIDLFNFLKGLLLKRQEIELYDDGKHDDYEPGDGIFAGTFLGGDVPGPYLVTAKIEGQYQGKIISRQIQESFQIGPIQNNKVTISDFIKILLGY